MASSRNSTYILVGLLAGTVLLCWGLGALNARQTAATDDGLQGLSTLFGLSLGIVASAVGLITGAISNRIRRTFWHRQPSIAGYAVPCATAVLYMAALLIT